MVASTPTTVPCITVPFFNSIVTCSLFSFCKNLTNFILKHCVLDFVVRLMMIELIADQKVCSCLMIRLCIFTLSSLLFTVYVIRPSLISPLSRRNVSRHTMWPSYGIVHRSMYQDPPTWLAVHAAHAKAVSRSCTVLQYKQCFFARIFRRQN